MRVWDIHPGYLARGNLLGQHAEIHALYTVLSGSGSGYRHHPETLRWQGRLQQLVWRHDKTVAEMKLRGFNHKSPLANVAEEPMTTTPGYVDAPTVQIGMLEEKNRIRGAQGRIPLPRRGSELWAQHKYSVMARGYGFYREIQQYLAKKEDLAIAQEEDLIDRILHIMDLPVESGALANTTDHLWGYFKDKASPGEREEYKAQAARDYANVLVWLYSLAEKYRVDYLVHSTVFGDVIDC